MSLQNPEPQNAYPVVYSPTAGAIDQVPAPEPATVLAWTSVIAAPRGRTSLSPQPQAGHGLSNIRLRRRRALPL